MSVLEIIIVVCFTLGAGLYVFLAIWDLKHPERKEAKKKAKEEKKALKEKQKNEKENDETGMY